MENRVVEFEVVVGVVVQRGLSKGLTWLVRVVMVVVHHWEQLEVMGRHAAPVFRLAVGLKVSVQLVPLVKGCIDLPEEIDSSFRRTRPLQPPAELAEPCVSVGRHCKPPYLGDPALLPPFAFANRVGSFFDHHA